MKRSFRLFLLPILFGSAGCTTVDNNVGSLGADAGPGDGPRKDASGAPAQPADASAADSGLCGCVVQAGSPDFVQQPLECRCAKGGCPMTIQDMSSRPECADGKTVLGDKGCGKLQIHGNAMGGTGFVFDAQSGGLVGVSDYSDIPWGSCNVWVYWYGERLLSTDCASIVSCAVCGPSAAPPCSTAIDAAAPDGAGMAKDVAQDSPSSSIVPDASSEAKDAASESISPDAAIRDLAADTTASTCPANEPALDSVCQGAVNCTYSYDCIYPCRPGCVPIGPAPSGVSRYWSCQDGHWTTNSDLTVRCLSYMEDCQCPG